ncbi:hypothetical protein Pfo_030583 [Paulownia fortunei]|nr:hypothetical protein Pfo_030583 [Paulownia fortunei]
MGKLYDGSCFSKEKWGFELQVLSSRWFTIFASVLIMSVNGATYLFGVYSNNIKSSLGYDQTTLNLVSFFKDLGGNLGIISGLINEITPPWVVLAIGAVMNFFGYFMIWLAVTGRTAKPHVWQMCLYIWIGADSQAFANTGSLITCVKNFPESRGIVLGLLKGFVGLSGAIMTQLYHALHGNDTNSLVLFIGWLPAAVSIIFLRTIRIMKVSRQQQDLKIFSDILYLSLALAGFLMIIIIVQNRFEFRRIEYVGSASVVVILLFVPLAIIIREEFYEWKNQKRLLDEASQAKIVTENTVQVELTPPPVDLKRVSSVSEAPTSPQNPVSCIRNVLNPPARGEDYTILQALFSMDMLILFIATSYNLGQIAKSLGYHTNSITTFVSLVSIWNYLGRVAAGFTSEIFLTKYRFPRPLMLTFVLLFSCVGHLLIALAIPNSLYVASVIIGFCFGAQWPLLFAIISDIFGLKYYSTLFQFGAVASPVGAYVLNVKVAGHLYDQEAIKQMAAKGLVRKPGEDLTCLGGECYKLSFIIITVATFFGCMVSLILVLRTREFYKGDIYRKFKEEAKGGDPAASASNAIKVEHPA